MGSDPWSVFHSNLGMSCQSAKHLLAVLRALDTMLGITAHTDGPT